jgi:hypothetical protein
VAGFDRALGQAQEPAWVPLTDVDPLRIALAWRDGERSPLVPGGGLRPLRLSLVLGT